MNSLNLSNRSKCQVGIISGIGICPDLHRKTYFKETTSVHIQNSPKTVLKRSPESRYRHNKKTITLSNILQVEGEDKMSLEEVKLEFQGGKYVCGAAWPGEGFTL
jgi:hypothetical protein